MPLHEQAQKHLDEANNLSGQKKFNAAFREFDAAIRLHHSNSKAYADFGAALVRAGRYSEAIEQFKKAPGFDSAIELDVDKLATALGRNIRQKQALDEFQKIVDSVGSAELINTWAQVLTKLQQYERAIEEFKKALKKNPELIPRIDLLANALEKGGSTEAQIQSFQKTIDELNNAQAWNTWGVTLLELQKYSAGVDQFKKAADAKKDWAAPHINLGHAFTELSDYQAAIDAYKTVLKCEKPSAGSYVDLGEALYRNEQYEEAVSNYKLASETTPSYEYFEPWIVAIKKLPNADSAITDYEQALEKVDKTELFTSAYVGLGTICNEVNRRPKSAIQFAKGIALAVDNSEPPGDHATQKLLAQTISDIEKPDYTLNAIQSIFDATADPKRLVQWCIVLAASNQTDLALEQFSRVIADLPKLPTRDSILMNLALAFQSAKTDGVALARIGEELDKKDNGDLQVAWARILGVVQNDPQQSLNLYKKLLLNKPKSAGLVPSLVEALRSSPNKASTITDLRAAVNDTSNADVCYHWALILIELDESKAALEELERAISLGLNHADVHFKLGQLYNKQANYTEAWEQFQKTLALDQDRIDAVREVGTVLLNCGQPDEAIAKYLEVIKSRKGASPSDDLLAMRDSLTWDKDTVDRFQKVFDEINTPESYRDWGVFLIEVKHPERAIEQFEKAIELDPDSTTIYPKWLKALGACGLPPKLVSEYEESILKYRKNAGAYSELGDFLYRLKRTEEALRCYRQALELDQKETRARIGSIYCLMDLNNMNEARSEAQQLQADNPNSGPAHDCLSLCDFLDGKYQEVVNRCELGIKQRHFYLYDKCARALYKLQKKDEALTKYDEALKERLDDVDIPFNKAALLMEMGRTQEAAAILDDILKSKPEHAYANHNLAAIAYDRGRYEDAWGEWKKAVKAYEQQESLLTRAIEKGRYVDSNEAYNYASVVFFIFHNHDEAERILKDGRDFHPTNTFILALMATLYWEKKEEITDLDAESSRKKSELHKLGMDCFQKAERLLLERSDRYPNYSIFVELGDLYLLHEDYEKARGYFEKAKERDSTAYLPHGKLGVAYLRDRQADKAIPLLLDALKLNSDDLDLKSSLAEAYLRAERLNDAEMKYREVLNQAPNHVQSSIGLGELCSALGEKDPDRYSEAIDLFTKALELAENEKSRSKYLTKKEKAAAYYQIGFARVQCYESSGIRRDTKLLDQARKDFDKCITLNPSHQKAKRAKEKIEKRLAFFTRDRLTETVGPRSIYRMSIAVFVLVQFAFFVAPLLNQPSSFKVTDRSVRAVEKELTAEQLQSLKGLVNQKFGNREMLAKILEPLPGNVAETVLQNVDAIKPIENAPDLPVGYYALLTFGSLLFMVVGLYLPQILKLKVPGIELEKSSIDQATVGDQAFAASTLGISKP